MKTNQEVANAWAMGYSAKSNNMFTDGVTIYSYGYHFPIATRVNGHVLYNRTYYSSTTCKHQSHVRRAIRYNNVIYCRAIDANENERYTRCFVEGLLRKIPNCRKIDDRVNDVMSELNDYGAYLAVMNEKEPKWYRDVMFALSNLKDKTLRIWCKNYKF